MRVGFIGNSSLSGQITDSLKQTGHKVTGGYQSSKGTRSKGPEEHPSAESLINSADLVYVANDDLPLFEICKIAIKESRHLYIESPFFLDYELINHLYHLANESKSVIRLAQKLMAHPVYMPVRFELNPLYFNIRMDFPSTSPSFDYLRNSLFNIISIVWDSVHRDLRKMSYMPLEYNTPYPRAFLFDMDFENGSRGNILFNHLSDQAFFKAEFMRMAKRFLLDFTASELLAYDEEDGPEWSSPGESETEADLIGEDFRNFLTDLDENLLPLTVNEDNQKILSLTHSLLNEMYVKNAVTGMNPAE